MKESTMEDIDNMQQKINPTDINDFSFIRNEWNEKLIIQSTFILVQSTILKFSSKINTDSSFESFHFGIKGLKVLKVLNTLVLKVYSIKNLFTNRTSAFSRLSYVRKAS